jgi:cytochrome c5
MNLGFGRLVVLTGFFCFPSASLQASDISDELIAEFQTTAAEVLSAERGAALWVRDFDGRSCTTCHTESLYGTGRHPKTLSD